MSRFCTCLFGNTVVDEEKDPKTIVEDLGDEEPKSCDKEGTNAETILHDLCDLQISSEQSNNPTEEGAFGVHYSILENLIEMIPESIDKNQATTKTIITEVVKSHPKLMELKASWFDMLRAENACTSDGLPLFGKAAIMISHTWQYKFMDTAATVIAFAKEYEAKNSKPCIIWMDIFLLNQFDTESFDPNWLKEKFTNVIKETDMTLSIMSPFEDPITIKRVWCLWELYLSTRYSNLHISLPPDQTIRFENALLTDPYSVTKLIEQINGIDAENAEAFDPKDKIMIFEEIEKSIGFDELNQVVVTFLRQWIEDQCQEKIDSIKSGALDAKSAMSAPTSHYGSGSTLFRAITLRSTGLVKLSLLHPDVSKVINGTSDSWPPFANSLSMGLCDIADELMEHEGFNFGQPHWQIDSYMIAQKPNHSYHPDFDDNVPNSRVEKTLRKYFKMRIEAGHTEFSYEKFVELSKTGNLPQGWCY